MTIKTFKTEDVLGYGWHVMKENFWFFVGLMFCFFVFMYMPAIAGLIIDRIDMQENVRSTINAILNIIGFLIGLILAIGTKKIALSFCGGVKPSIHLLIDTGDCFWRYLGTYILVILVVACGLVLLIVPGIIWAVQFSLSFYFVIDKGLGPIEAMKASSRTTNGLKMELLVFYLACLGINIVGALCLLVGIFASYPVVMVASALVYKQLMEQTPEWAELGIFQPAIQPDDESFEERQDNKTTL